MAAFTTDDIPDLGGKLALVTGGNSGTGYETAEVLAGKGGRVVIAARNADKVADARARILALHPGADVRFEPLDLSSQGSVQAFADRWLSEGEPIDILVNNAGVMALEQRQETADGFEMQLATNYLGHFALTGRLLPLLRRPQARVVQLASIAHRQGQIRLDDLQFQTGYKAWPVYAQSKLAMLMFALELDRRSRANGWGLTSVGAHPGYARTSLIENGPMAGNAVARWGLRNVYRPFIEPLFSNSAAEGALPILLAATQPVEGGSYWGVTEMKELKGPPGRAEIAPQALDTAVAANLWDRSEQLTGVRFG